MYQCSIEMAEVFISFEHLVELVTLELRTPGLAVCPELSQQGSGEARKRRERKIA